jgi:hypothetical protein
VALNDSLAVREARLRAAPDDPVEKSKAALLMGLLGDAQVRLDALADAGRSYDRGASLCQDLLARDPDDEESRFLLATLLEGRAEVDLKAGRAREAETRLRSILADVRARLTSSPDDTRLRRLEVVAEHAMGQVFDGRKGGRAEACAHHLRALVGWTLVYGKQTLAKADAKQADEIRAAAEGCRSPVRASADSPSGG